MAACCMEPKVNDLVITSPNMLKRKKKKEVQPLGYALMTLRGAMWRLERAHDLRELSMILEERIALANAIDTYTEASDPENIKKEALITYTYLEIGSSDLTTAYTMIRSSSFLLSSGLRLA